MGQKDEDEQTLGDHCVESSACSSTASSNSSSSSSKLPSTPSKEDQDEDPKSSESSSSSREDNNCHTTTTIINNIATMTTSSSSASVAVSTTHLSQPQEMDEGKEECSDSKQTKRRRRKSDDADDDDVMTKSSSLRNDFDDNLVDVNVDEGVGGRRRRRGDMVVDEEERATSLDESNDGNHLGKEIIGGNGDCSSDGEEEEDEDGVKREEEDEEEEGLRLVVDGGNSSSSSGSSSRGDDHHDRKRVGGGFGLAGLSLGLSKVFHRDHHRSQSSTSTERLVLLNNQMMVMSPTCNIASSVSKSSSESNIPMCHNSLDNLAEDLPSSRSTDSSCLLTNPGDTDEIDIQIRTRSIRQHNNNHNNNHIDGGGGSGDHEHGGNHHHQQHQNNMNGGGSGSGGHANLKLDHHHHSPIINELEFCRNISTTTSENNLKEQNVGVGGDKILNRETRDEAGHKKSVSSSSSSSSSSSPSESSITSSSNSTTSQSSSSGGGNRVHGPKFKLISEGDLQVCKVKHGQNLMSKLSSSKLLRRYESHHLYLNDSCISSKTPIGCLVTPIPYWQMEEVYVVVRWDSGRRYVIRIVLPDGSLLLQGSNAYVRDQWYHSIIWKKNIFKYHNLMRSSKRPEVILKELKSLVDFATVTPLQDDCISHVPIEIVSTLLDSAGDLLGKSQAEEVLVALSPLLERSHPPPSLCRFFSRHCRTRPRCPLVGQLLTPVVRRALKHNVDFGKYPYMKHFIQDYIQALNCHNDGINVVRNFVKSVHGPASSCPHPRVLSNLVSVCLAAIFAIFERNNAKRASNLHNADSLKDIPWDEQLLCYMAVFDTISEFEDWRPSLAQLLQPIPFPLEDALANPLFSRSLSSVIRRIGSDSRCDVHQMVMGIRDGKEGWFHLFSPSNLACSDDGELWGIMLGRLLSCCCRRKRFLVELGGKLLGSCLLLALREHSAAQEALCLLLEWQVVQSDDQRVQIATTLQSTPTGSANYAALCSRQLHLKELQQKGGPRKLTLPSRSTDADLAKLLSCGSFGNLECLSLAFTQVTSACAEQLIKLPSLRYLNLWSTQFGDTGLETISEHLPNLQVLNLCETPVTDKGLLSLTCVTSLRKLNLNSTHLSQICFDSLKKKLPALKEVDVRYTDAW